ncbi:hypothetical protein Q4489_16295 [Thalassotalea sp. 1_MG-2023]|uniref:hypothetical protein n=1 Tax=Thalassotalea sp. 1_MG-2023 TaxID=3062680 RepID=UPI0026E22877|nr:hypothetical protein [Thalassotalea sp. 1_MG-2023]MDO6428574.1 hypothetical protein [Thalassotalea sp. 1_MG-2023]
MKLIWIFILICSAGCSQKQLYQVGQEHQKNDCIKRAMTESEYRECLRAEQLSHKEYKQIRKQVIEDK